MPSRPTRIAHLALHYARGLAHLRAEDVVLASFPRSGSTYLRRILAECLEPSARAELAEPMTFAQVDARMPEWGTPHLRPARAGAPPRFVKTHRPYTPLLRRQRAVLLVRDPLDALASYHHLWSARKEAEPMERSAFLRDSRLGLPRWIRHTRSWQPRAALVLRYAALRAEPEETARAVLRIAGLRVDDERIRRAVALSSAEQVRRVQEASGLEGFREDFVFAADRRAGSGTAYFGASDVVWARAELGRAELDDFSNGSDEAPAAS